jgi:hypothetical protein
MWHLMADDVALIELAEPLPLSDRVRPICLSSLKVTAASEEGLRKGAVIAGWGKPSIHDHMESLHAARLDVAPVDYCSE